MTYMAARGVRIGFVTSLAAVLIAGICGDAVARTHHRTHHRVHVRHLHARSASFDSHAQLAPQPPVQPGTMRYYGGPKSPMWRGPSEN
jgi:hypothetical protein